MARLSRLIRASEIAKLIDGVLEGEDREVGAVSTLLDSKEGELSFLWDRSLCGKLKDVKASVIVLPYDFDVELKDKTLIRVKDSKVAMVKLLRELFKKEHPVEVGVHELAYVEEDVTIEEGARIAPFSYIGRGSKIGSNTVVYPFVFIGENVKIGRDCVIYPMVSIREDVEIGDRVVIHSGAVIGSDGFGFIPLKEGVLKIPQVGIVVIEDDVEIGANVTIDRATVGETRIGKGSKIDNLVQIAHNVKIGRDVLIAALCGIAGSSSVGDRVMMGGQAGVKDHVSVGESSVIAARSGVTKDIPSGSFVSGFPAMDHKEELRLEALIRRLPELFQRIKELERRVKG